MVQLLIFCFFLIFQEDGDFPPLTINNTRMEQGSGIPGDPQDNQLGNPGGSQENLGKPGGSRTRHVANTGSKRRRRRVMFSDDDDDDDDDNAAENALL